MHSRSVAYTGNYVYDQGNLISFSNTCLLDIMGLSVAIISAHSPCKHITIHTRKATSTVKQQISADMDNAIISVLFFDLCFCIKAEKSPPHICQLRQPLDTRWLVDCGTGLVDRQSETHPRWSIQQQPWNKTTIIAQVLKSLICACLLQ